MIKAGNYLVGVVLLLFGLSIHAADSAWTEDKKQLFIDSMVGQYGYTREQLNTIFSTVLKDERILAKITHPAEKTIPWYRYRQIFMDAKRVANGVHFYHQHKTVLSEAYHRYGVSPAVIVAILGVETRYGKVMGNDQVIRALSTIAFGYPKRETFFTNELRAFLQMTAQQQLNPLQPLGSYAGAMGMAQFMPSSYLNYAVDYEGDGKKDLWSNANDAIFSIANYLSRNGWQKDGKLTDKAILSASYGETFNHKPFTTVGALREKGVIVFADDSQAAGLLKLQGKDVPLFFVTYKNFSVITTYNTSPKYAMAVIDLAKAIEDEIK
ncbi:MAG: lytic murein transglycosylase B [Gammaproteobacteria bacterium]|nr:MAG: lytic murein transglycosylase B [Gammaproteobacteria bacterium]